MIGSGKPQGNISFSCPLFKLGNNGRRFVIYLDDFDIKKYTSAEQSNDRWLGSLLIFVFVLPQSSHTRQCTGGRLEFRSAPRAFFLAPQSQVALLQNFKTTEECAGTIISSGHCLNLFFWSWHWWRGQTWIRVSSFVFGDVNHTASFLSVLQKPSCPPEERLLWCSSETLEMSVGRTWYLPSMNSSSSVCPQSMNWLRGGIWPRAGGTKRRGRASTSVSWDPKRWIAWK